MTSSKQRREAAFIALDRDRTTGLPNEWFETTPFIRFDQATGEILEYGNMSIGGLKLLQETAGWFWLPQSGRPETHYVNTATGRRRVKAACPAILDGLVLRNLPRPCRIEITEEATGRKVYEETETEVELVFDHPGAYTVRVLSVPFTPGEFVVTV